MTNTTLYVRVQGKYVCVRITPHGIRYVPNAAYKQSLWGRISGQVKEHQHG